MKNQEIFFLLSPAYVYEQHSGSIVCGMLYAQVQLDSGFLSCRLVEHIVFPHILFAFGQSLGGLTLMLEKWSSQMDVRPVGLFHKQRTPVNPSWQLHLKAQVTEYLLIEY